LRSYSASLPNGRQARSKERSFYSQMSPKIVNSVVVLTVAGLSLAIVANSVTKPVGRDEQMYCTGAVLLGQGKMIYRDFSYPAQLPYHPLLYAGLFRMLNTTHYLLVGRIVSSVCDILVLVCIIGIYRCILGSFRLSGTLFGLAGAALYVFNPLVDYANGFAWNHDVVILCVVLSLWLLLSTDFKHKSRYWRIAAIGALLTGATFMRITTALVELLFLIILLVQPAESLKQRAKVILPFLISSAVVLIWPVWVVAQAPRAFYLNVFWIPALYGEWLREIGMVHSKFELTLSSIRIPGYFVLIVIAIYLCLATVCLRSKLKISNVRNLLLAALLPVAFFVIALIPPTMWRQYLAMPVPFLIISFAYPLRYLRTLGSNDGSSIHFKISCALVALGTVVAVVSYPFVLYRIPVLLGPESWVPIRLHSISETIGRKTHEPGLALTLAPLFALEGGSDIYTELSAGPIVYRIADSLSPSDRQITHTAGPKTLPLLLEKAPPSAVILGVEPSYEEPISKSVEPDSKDWEKQVYDLVPALSLLPIRYQLGQQLLVLYRR